MAAGLDILLMGDIANWRKSVTVSCLFVGIIVAGCSAQKKEYVERPVEELYNQALDQVASETNRDAMEVFETALRNVTPTVEVKPRRVGGATYQVPVEVPERRRNALAMRWLIRSARARTGQPMRSRLAAEIIDASRGQGAAARRREEMHRMAEANRAFVHYRW